MESVFGNQTLGERQVKCRICLEGTLTCIYEGPVRAGQYGELSNSPRQIWKCGACETAALKGSALDYHSASYRRRVDGDESPQAYYARHDGEQLQRLRVLGTSGIRGKVVADVGCGAGSFLDLLQGMAHTTLAIEPALSYGDELRRKGHLTFTSCEQALGPWRGKVDLLVSFAVIEHVEDPVAILKQMRELLRPDGRILLSTPNADDWLLKALPEDYPSFFYREAHLWYFSGLALERLGQRAGFGRVKVVYQNQYDFSNALVWLRDKRPTGVSHMPGWEHFDETWTSSLERAGTSNFLYAWLEP